MMALLQFAASLALACVVGPPACRLVWLSGSVYGLLLCC